MFKKPDDLSFVTWCVIVLDAEIRRSAHCGHKEMDMIAKSAQAGLNDSYLVLRKKSPTTFHHNQQCEPLI